MFAATPKPFEAHASVLLLSPPGGNAYIDDNPALFSAADVVALQLDTPAARSKIGVEYTIGLDDSINEPLLLLSTKSRDAARAQKAIGALERELESSLATLQHKAGAPSTTTIRTQVLTQTPRAEVTRYDAIEHAILVTPVAFLAGVFGRRIFRRQHRGTLTDASFVSNGVVA